MRNNTQTGPLLHLGNAVVWDSCTCTSGSVFLLRQCRITASWISTKLDRSKFQKPLSNLFISGTQGGGSCAGNRGTSSTKSCVFGMIRKQNGHPGLWLAETIFTSLLLNLSFWPVNPPTHAVYGRVGETKSLVFAVAKCCFHFILVAWCSGLTKVVKQTNVASQWQQYVKSNNKLRSSQKSRYQLKGPFITGVPTVVSHIQGFQSFYRLNLVFIYILNSKKKAPPICIYCSQKV